ncbi:hypothetical protein PF008_g8629 [Phytophthora fragariae]|uniref:Uncharacterized protein n=1 Tax=Phytophthora fragariae TaxID=53985 RepID=A0A6G0RYY4_9STRA|nr:hypothetical protein PF008_g8629 [Phytophthora fragariae]
MKSLCGILAAELSTTSLTSLLTALTFSLYASPT